jgi:hypothetical protein
MDSGRRITGGGSGYAAILAHAGGVLYGTELGSVTLKRIGFLFVFQLNTQHTWSGTTGGQGPGRPPFGARRKESCKGLGSVTFKINTQHTLSCMSSTCILSLFCSPIFRSLLLLFIGLFLHIYRSLKAHALSHASDNAVNVYHNTTLTPRQGERSSNY